MSRAFPDQELDRLIRQGSAEEATRVLDRWLRAKIPCSDYSQVAEVMRRLGQPKRAIELLAPKIHGTSRVGPSANPEEQAEYAISLARTGCLTEAQTRLSKISDQDTPKKNLFEGMLAFHFWDPEGAITPLTKYLKQEGVSDYQRGIGKINLLAAYVGSENSPLQVEELFHSIQPELDRTENSLLRGNVSELMIHHFCSQKKFQKAQEEIGAAIERRTKLSGFDGLFFEKWRTWSEICLSPSSRHSELIQKLRLSARELNHFETLRECDLFEAVVTRQEELALKLYFCTHFEGYRGRVLRWWGQELPRPEFWSLRLDQTAYVYQAKSKSKFKGATSAIDWEQLHLEGHLKSGSLLARALEVLLRDPYRKLSVGELYDRIYPGESFQSQSASLRIKQVIFRLNALLREVRTGARFLVKNDRVSLELTQALDVSLPLQALRSPLDRILEDQGLDLSTRDLAKSLGLSESQARRKRRQLKSDREILK
jgi:hypothetical protein